MLTRKALALTAAAVVATAASLAAQAPWLSPLGPPVQVNAEEQQGQGVPALALDPSGNLTAVWEKGDFLFTTDLWARHLDPSGAPGAAESRIDSAGFWHERRGEVVAPLGSSGRSVAAWINVTSLLSLPARRVDPRADTIPAVIEGRFLGAGGAPASPPFPISLSEFPTGLHLAALRSGGFVASWSDTSPEGNVRAVARRFDDAGQPAGPEIVLDTLPRTSCQVYNLGLGALADGGFTDLWLEYSYPSSTGGCTTVTRGQRFASNGQPVGPAFELAFTPGDFFFTVRADGSSVAVNLASSGSLTGRLFTAAGQPLGSTFSIADGVRFDPEVSVDDGGNLLVAWPEGSGGGVLARFFNAAGEPLSGPFVVTAEPVGIRATADGQGTWAVAWNEDRKIFARRFALCPGDGSHLCLSRARFRAEVAWRNPRTGETGTGHAVPLTGATGDTGAFWFFAPENLELMVKVLDGRAVNGRFWVFYGSLTDVEYTLTVTDAVTGEQQTYHNPARTLGSRADTDAFLGAAPVAMPTAIPPRTAASPGGPPPCPNALCLGGGRFGVDVAWRDPRTGATGAGSARTLTADTGAFWFFAPQNLELMIKVLDGRAANGHFWIFFGSLSDVEYTVKITDTSTGVIRVYHNPPYTLASRADTLAF